MWEQIMIENHDADLLRLARSLDQRLMKFHINPSTVFLARLSFIVVVGEIQILSLRAF